MYIYFIFCLSMVISYYCMCFSNYHNLTLSLQIRIYSIIVLIFLMFKIAQRNGFQKGVHRKGFKSVKYGAKYN